MTDQTELLQLLGDSIGVYGTSPTGYLSLAARLEDFELADFNRVLYEDRTAARVRCMRGSLYTLPQELLVVAFRATQARYVKSFSQMAKRALLSDDPDLWADRIGDQLSDGQPLSVSDLRERLAPPSKRDAEALKYVVAKMASEGLVVRATASGGWRSDRFRYALWSDWLPGVDLSAMDEREAQRELALVYFGSYGPASVDDFAWWAGLTAGETAAATRDVDLDRPGPSGRLEGVRLLPVWDVLLVAYRDRSRLVDDERLPFVYDRSGNATSVVLVDGRVEGVWDLGKEDRRMEFRVAPFGDLVESTWFSIEAEAERIGALIEAESVTIVRCAEPLSLSEGPRNRFMAPLRDAQPV